MTICTALKYHTEPEAADILRIHVNTLKKRRKAGQIGFSRATPGEKGKVLYSDDDLREYNAALHISARRAPTPPAPKYRRAGTWSRKNQQALLDII